MTLIKNLFLIDLSEVREPNLYIRKQLSERLGISMDKISIRKTALGRPYIEKLPVYLSLSRCHGWMAFAYSTDQNCGVDLASPHEVGVDQSFLKTFLSKNEISLVKSSPNPHLSASKLWSAKEAVSKALGVGFQFPYRAITLSTLHGNTAAFYLTRQKQGTVYWQERNGMVLALANTERGSPSFLNSQYAAHPFL